MVPIIQICNHLILGAIMAGLFMAPALASITSHETRDIHDYLKARHAAALLDLQQASNYSAAALKKLSRNINKQSAAERLESEVEGLKVLEANLFNTSLEFALISGNVERADRLLQNYKALSDTDNSLRFFRILREIKKGNYGLALKRTDDLPEISFDIVLKPLMRSWILMKMGKREQARMELPDWRNQVGVQRSYLQEQSGYILYCLKHYDQALETLKSFIEENRESKNIAATTIVRARIEAAAAAQRLGKLKEAKTLLSTGNQQSNALLLRAKNRLKAGKGIKAPVRKITEGLASMYLRVAGELAGRRQHVALIYAQIASWLNPADDNVKIFLGIFLSDQIKDYNLALKFIDKIGKRSPLYLDGQILRSNILYVAGQYEDALANARRLLQYFPDKPNLYLTMGNLYRALEHQKEAVQAYSKAIELVDRQPQLRLWNLYFLRAAAYERLKKHDAMENDLKKALKMQPDNPAILNFLGYSLLEAGRDIEEAGRLISRALELSPDNSAIIDSKGWYYYMIGNYKQAVTILERASQSDPYEPTISEHLGDVYWKLGKRLEARQSWNAALYLEPDKKQVQRINRKLELGPDLE